MLASARSLATAMFARLPHQIADRIHPLRRRLYRESGVTTVRPAGRRLLIGPVNSAGQAHAWARAAERLPDVAAVNLMFRSEGDAFVFPADHVVSASFAAGTRRWQNAERKAIVASFTHVILESGMHVFDKHLPARHQLEVLDAAGLRSALLFHGSDVRLPSQHAAGERDSPFADPESQETALLEAVARANHELISSADVPVFVSTPDLLDSVPTATWLPVVVEPGVWSRSAPQRPLLRPRPVVVHAPSRAGLKGTALIADAVQRLHDEGIIEYRETQGIPAARMPEFYGAADIVLDQFSLGIYGVAACEAMAAGRLVISHVSESVRARVREATGQDLPILQSRAREVESTLRAIAAAPGSFVDLAQAGPRFVDEVHDGARSAQVLASFLGVSGAGASDSR